MSKRILIVDDEVNIRRMMRLTLESAGYEVGEASDGPQALEAYSDGASWDVILLDQRMPGMDGLEVLRKMRRYDPAARAVMVTAYASIELAVDAMKVGATDFVRKPMTPEVLRGVVQAALAKRTGQGELKTATPAEAKEAADIPTLTLNGFEIHRQGTKTGSDNVHRFVIKTPAGEEKQVSVEISDTLVAYVERMTRRQLPAGNSFWAMHAERFLGNYLWTEGKLPSGNRLTLSDIDQAELPVAAGWTEE